MKTEAMAFGFEAPFGTADRASPVVPLQPRPQRSEARRRRCLMRFSTGDVVRERSSETKMTVRSVVGERVECDWFDKADQHHRETFDAAKLEKVEGL